MPDFPSVGRDMAGRRGPGALMSGPGRERYDGSEGDDGDAWIACGVCFEDVSGRERERERERLRTWTMYVRG